MRFLIFDHNLSPKLVNRLDDLYPDSTHVDTLGLGSSDDAEVWEYARINDYMIVTKDADFSELSVMRGSPPKVIWIRRGNCSTRDIEKLLRDSYMAIFSLSEDTDISILTLF